MIKIKVSAKINLSLKVGEKKSRLHELDMVTASLDLFDVVTLSRSNALDCNLTDMVEKEKNSAYIAAKKMCERFKLPPVSIKIEKNIPLAAGMGGSSADAAAVIVGMTRLFDLKWTEEIEKIALEVGSDVPMMCKGGFLHVCGFGEKIQPIQTPLEFYFVAVMGEKGCSAKESYAAFDELKQSSQNKTHELIRALENCEHEKAVSLFENDLTKASISVNSEIADSISLLNEANPIKKLMMGSGSAVVGVFDCLKNAKNAYVFLSNRASHCFLLKTVQNGIEIIE